MVFCTPWRLLLVSTGIREGKPRTEVIQNEEGRQSRRRWYQRLMQQRLKKCFFVLDIRQGTILIALLELIVLLFFGIIVSMVLLHVLETEALIMAEVEDSPARESIALSGLSGQEAIIAEVNNESRLQVGLNLAAYKVLGISCVLMSILLHIVSSALLLLGAILRKRGMMIMWFCTTTTDLTVTLCGMFVAVAEVAIRDQKFEVGLDVFVAVGIIGALWLLHNMAIVASLYWDLYETRQQRVRSPNVIRNLHINIRPDWNVDADVDVEMLGDGAANAAVANAAEANASSPDADSDVVQVDDDAAGQAYADADADDAELDKHVPSKPLIPDFLSDPSSELAQTLRQLK